MDEFWGTKRSAQRQHQHRQLQGYLSYCFGGGDKKKKGKGKHHEAEKKHREAEKKHKKQREEIAKKQREAAEETAKKQKEVMKDAEKMQKETTKSYEKAVKKYDYDDDDDDDDDDDYPRVPSVADQGDATASYAPSAPSSGSSSASSASSAVASAAAASPQIQELLAKHAAKKEEVGAATTDDTAPIDMTNVPTMSPTVMYQMGYGRPVRGAGPRRAISRPTFKPTTAAKPASKLPMAAGMAALAAMFLM
jgi:hypothetical protein